jgi:bifunctional non-homologous end joining protein LigD
MQSPPTPSRSADPRDVVPEHAEGHGDKLFAAACRLGLEGIVAKKLDAPYRSAVKGVAED